MKWAAKLTKWVFDSCNFLKYTRTHTLSVGVNKEHACMTPTGLAYRDLFRGKVAHWLTLAPGDWGALTLNQVSLDTAPKTPIHLGWTQTLNTWRCIWMFLNRPMNKACIVLLMIEQQNWKQGINRERYCLFYSGVLVYCLFRHPKGRFKEASP